MVKRLGDWPWLNPECSDCKHARVIGEREHDQLYHAARCNQVDILAWVDANPGHADRNADGAVMPPMARPCKQHKKRRTRYGQ